MTCRRAASTIASSKLRFILGSGSPRRKELLAQLGIVPDLSYQEAAIQVKAGDTIIAFTDGATEAMNADKKIFGRARLESLIAAEDGDDPAFSAKPFSAELMTIAEEGELST